MSIYHSAFTDILHGLQDRTIPLKVIPAMDKESLTAYKENRPGHEQLTKVGQTTRMIWPGRLGTHPLWHMSDAGMDFLRICLHTMLEPLKGRVFNFDVYAHWQSRPYTHGFYTQVLHLPKGAEPSTVTWLDKTMQEWLTELRKGDFPFKGEQIVRRSYLLSFYTCFYKREGAEKCFTDPDMFEDLLKELPEETVQYETNNLCWAGHQTIVMLEWRDNKLSTIIIDEVEEKEYYWPIFELINIAMKRAAVKCQFPMAVNKGPIFHNKLYKSSTVGMCVSMNTRALVQLAVFDDPKFITTEVDKLLEAYISLQLLRMRKFCMTSPLKDDGVFMYPFHNIVQNDESTLLDMPSNGTILWLSKDASQQITLYFDPNIDAPVAFSPLKPRKECSVLVDDIYFNETLDGSIF